MTKKQVKFSLHPFLRTLVAQESKLKTGFYIGFLLLFMLRINGQDSLEIYLLGNTADVPPSSFCDFVVEDVKNSRFATRYFLGTGDYFPPQAIINEANIHLTQLKNIFNSVTDYFLLSGDREWDYNGVIGLDKMKDLDRTIQKDFNIKNGLEFDEGCPGPVLKELSDYSVLILVNSQWFIHPHEKPVSSDNDCDLFNEEDFWEELEELIEESSGKRILIASHHNIYGHGDYSGEKRYVERWTIPVIGQFMADYKKNVGRPQDFAFEPYARFQERMKDLLANYANIIYLSGHEHTSEVIVEHNNIFINAGAIGKNMKAMDAKNQIYRSEDLETIKLIISNNLDVGVAILKQSTTKELIRIPWNNIGSALPKGFFPPIDSGRYVAGPEYKAGGFKKFWMGEQYRHEWTTPINAPKLWLDTFQGGLIPYAKGGGLQTASLKLKSPEGRKYAFRSINKNPEKALDKQIRETIYRHLVKDLITTQHPYGSLTASALLDQTDILHVNPELYYLPYQESLGEFKDEFAGMLGTLELRPDSKSAEIFGDVDDIVSTHIMYRKLINEDDHLVDKKAYAKARVFDMWVGDWDRHQDNWKWAAYKKDGLTVYKPIPRDRDHVFSQWEGVIPTLADWFIPNAEHFDYTFGNVRHLNWKARHLDRFVGNELSLQDWTEAAEYLQDQINILDIENAVNKMPIETINQSGNEIKNKLISRLSDLPRAVKEHYKLISGEVNIVGSNKKDHFEIKSLPDGGLDVSNYDGDKRVYHRIFDSEYTKRIYVYGLGKKDEFVLDFPFDSKIKVKIIGGKGEDTINEVNIGTKKDVKVYDHSGDDILEGDNLKRDKSHKDPEYNVNEFEYPAILPFIGLKSSSGNRLGIQFTLSVKKNIFNKPDFGRITDFEAIYYPQLKAYLFDLKHRYRYFWGKQDLRTRLVFSSYYSRFPFFYGLGNKSERDDELYEEGFYRIDYNTIKSNFGFSKSFWQQSSISYYGLLEYNNVDKVEDSTTLLGNSDKTYYGLGKLIYYGLGVDLSIDMRNSQLFTRHGSLIELKLKAYKNKLSSFINLHTHLAKYTTYHLFSPTTFIIAGGLYHTMGDAPFYMQSSLGSNTNLRGHVRNRYVDRSAFYYNTEVRVHLGTIRTVLAPIRFGTYIFHDSGKVFDGNFSIKKGMHPTYGLGMYFAPLDDDYSFTLTFAKSDDRENYFRMDFGWNL